MSIPLKDFRLGITERISAYLEAHAIHHDTTEAQIARQVLQKWADEQHRISTLAAQALRNQSGVLDNSGVE